MFFFKLMLLDYQAAHGLKEEVMHFLNENDDKMVDKSFKTTTIKTYIQNIWTVSIQFHKLLYRPVYSL